MPLSDNVVSDFVKVVEDLEKAGQLPHLPYGWLAMARVYRAAHEWEKAFCKLEETRLLSRCFEMKMHEIDCYLGYAEVYYARSRSKDRKEEDLKNAGRYLADAFQLASDLNYGFSLDRLQQLAQKVYGERLPGFRTIAQARDA